MDFDDEIISNLDLNDQQRRQMLDKLADKYHVDWTKTLEDEDGYPIPVMRITTDTSWITDHGTEQVDVANTSYAKLPADHKIEFQESAEDVLGIIDAMGGAVDLSRDETYQAVGETLHRGWLKRNQDRATETERLPFSKLPDKYKMMIINQVKEALKLLNI